MKTLIALAILASSTLTASAQITSADERIKREKNNARQGIDLDQVLANRFDIGDGPFLFKLHWSSTSRLKQIDANRWEISISSGDGAGRGRAHFPRAGAAVLDTLQEGDIVIARIKPDSDIILEILGVSAVNVWE
jgi:hypothetical protein